MKTEQCKFRELGEDTEIGGIIIDDTYVICGCCGGVFEMDDVEILERYEWLDISNEIKGN